MTTYTISLGYCAEGVEPDAFDRLIKSAESLRKQEREIVAEVLALEWQFTTEQILEYASNEILGNPSNRWLTIVHGATGDQDEDRVVLWASTGDPVKYAVRRAMVRLIMRDMHAQGIEVNVSVC